MSLDLFGQGQLNLELRGRTKQHAGARPPAPKPFCRTCNADMELQLHAFAADEWVCPACGARRQVEVQR